MLKALTVAVIAASGFFTASTADRWSATLNPVGGSTVSGTATVELVGTDSSRVTISIRGAQPNAVLPWHLHTGPCSAPAGVFGSESAYPKLQAMGGGTAEANVTLPVKPTESGTYAVQVHQGKDSEMNKDDAASPKPASDVVSCGDLKPVITNTPGQ
jgi:hypothetical protein